MAMILKTRVVKGGGVSIWQLILGRIVISITKNTAWFNGPKGWAFSIKRRSQTNL